MKTWMILLLLSFSFEWEGKGRNVSKRGRETFQVKIFTSRLNIVGDTNFFIFVRVSANYLISN